MSRHGVSRALRENGLTLVFGGLFIAALVGQALAGHAAYNQQQVGTGDTADSG